MLPDTVEREVVRLSVGPKAIDRGSGDVHEIDGPLIERELPGLEPGEVEKVTDQALEPARLGEDHLARGRRVAASCRRRSPLRSRGSR